PPPGRHRLRPSWSPRSQSECRRCGRGRPARLLIARGCRRRGRSRRLLLRGGTAGAGTAVDVVAGAGGVVADLLGDELLTLNGLPVALVLERVRVALGDEAVALGEPVVRTLGGGAVGHEVVERGLQLGERTIRLPPV